MLQYQNSTYILAQNADQDYCVSQIVASEKLRVCSVAHKVSKFPLVRLTIGNVHNQLPSSTGEHESIGINNSEVYHSNFINLLRQETSETHLFLSTIANCIENLYRKDQSLHEELLMQMWVAIFKDDLFTVENCHGLGVAAIAVFDIVGLFLKDSRIGNLIENIQNKLKLANPQISKRMPLFKETIQKFLLQHSSRKTLVDLLNSEVNEAIEMGSLHKEIVLKLDRVFQRALRTYDYYKPLYDEGFHRWFTYSLEDLIHYPERELFELARKEDTGIIRDLVCSLGKLWLLNKAGQNANVFVDDLMNENEQIWKDPQLDRFMSNSKNSSLRVSIDLQTFAGKQMEQKLLSACRVFLVELAFREKVTAENFSATGMVEERLEKWKQLSVYSELSEYIIEKLSQGYLVNDTKIESNIEEKISVEPKPQHLQEEITVKKENAFEETKSQRQASVTKLLKEEENMEPEKERKHDQSMEFENDSLAPKTADSKSGAAGGKSGRRGNKYQNRDKEVAQILPTPEEIGPKVQEPIIYHSIDNLRNCHSCDTLKNFKFYIAPSGNEIHGIFEDKFAKGVLAIQDATSKQLELIYLEAGLFSSINIWNSAVFLYFDRNLADRYSRVGKQYKDCILYADLRESFTENGRSKGIIVLSPVLKNDDGLVNRTLIADDQGIFLLGGSRVTTAKKNPIAYSNLCSYYHLEDLDSVSTKSIRGDMKPMHYKRDSLIVIQNNSHLFVAARDNWNPDKSCFGEKNTIEVYDKDEMEWLTTVEVPYDTSALNYSLMRVLDENEVLLFVANRSGKNSTGFMINMNSIAKPLEDDEKNEISVKKVSKFGDNSGGVLVLSGFEAFPLQNNYESSKVLTVRSYKKEIPENEEYFPIE